MAQCTVDTLGARIDAAARGRTIMHVRFDTGTGDELVWPLAVLRGGEGPTLFLSGGVHGDEFEGPAALSALIRSLDPARLAGRIIIAPMMNPPAIAARARCSPSDGGNLNRAFPGDAAGGLTWRIAAMVAQHIVPRADIIFDLHAGGADYRIVQSVMIHPRPEDRAAMLASLADAIAFAPEAVLIVVEDGGETMLDGEAERQGKRFGCAELGSLASLSPASAHATSDGVLRLLVHAGILPGPPPAAGPIRYLAALDGDHDMITPDAGYFIPVVDCGQRIAAGQAIGEMIDPLRPWDAPSIITARRGGTVYTLAAGGPLAAGATCAVIVDEVADADALLKIAITIAEAR